MFSDISFLLLPTPAPGTIPVSEICIVLLILSMLLGGFREMERVYLMTDGGPGGSTEIIGTYIYRATRSAGSNIGLVCAAAIIVLIVAFIISFIQLKMTSKNG